MREIKKELKKLITGSGNLNVYYLPSCKNNPEMSRPYFAQLLDLMPNMSKALISGANCYILTCNVHIYNQISRRLNDTPK